MVLDLPASLRLHPEPCQQIDDLAVHQALIEDPKGYIANLKSQLENISSGQLKVERPPKQIFPDLGTDGDFRVMPCVVRDGAIGFKTVKIVGTNLIGKQVPDQVTVGKAVVLHPEENFITHVIDACLLSSARTGAVVALAALKLAPAARSVRVIGCGRVAFYAVLYLATVCSLESVFLEDLAPDRARALASDLRDHLGDGIEFRLESGASADIVLAATTSTEPLLFSEEAGSQLTISVGADTEVQRELDSSFAELGAIYVDTEDGIHVGDLRAWRMEGFTCEPLIDICSLFEAKPGPEPHLFISTGTALMDNLTIRYLLDRIDG